MYPLKITCKNCLRKYNSAKIIGSYGVVYTLFQES